MIFSYVRDLPLPFSPLGSFVLEISIFWGLIFSTPPFATILFFFFAAVSTYYLNSVHTTPFILQTDFE